EISKIIVRALSKSTGQSVRQIYADKPSKEMLEKYKDVLTTFRKDNMLIQPTPVTYKEFAVDIREVIEEYPDKKIVVVIDNLENIRLTGNNQKLDMDMMMQEINLLKKEHPYIVFIVLNQLNRDLEDRIGDKRQQAPKQKDIYGTGALYKLCDIFIAINNPYKLGLEEYMIFNPENRYLYIDKSFKKYARLGVKTTSFKTIGNIFYHVLKARGLEEEYDMKDLYVKSIFNAPNDNNEEEELEY
ncbi:MAG: DnaB-like helicase C-terminal domain-containing protein, partial [Candidatus Paceibacterota bacterium]